MKTWIFIIFICTIQACTSSQKWNAITPETLEQSTITIQYYLRHNQYELIAVADKEQTKLSSFHDKKLIEEQKINQEQYLHLSNRIKNFIEDFQKQQSMSDEACKMPFRISQTTIKNTLSFEGCRQEDEKGQLGKLIQEVEILFYTK